ncbi:MAG: tetratricopeptide repeat protein [Xanthobacteraceae bacterium]
MLGIKGGHLMRVSGIFFAAIVAGAIVNTQSVAQQFDDVTICFRKTEGTQNKFGGDQVMQACTNFVNSKSGSVEDRWRAAIWLARVWYASILTSWSGEGSFGSMDTSIVLPLPHRVIDHPDQQTIKDLYDHTLAAYGAAIQVDPQNPDGYKERALVLRDAGDLDRAIADYDAALRLKPGDADLLIERGNTWRGKGDLIKAISDYSDDIKLFPFYLDAYKLRGFAYLLNGDAAAAVADLSHANKRADAYTSLLLFIARGRNGEDGTEELKANSARVLSEQWPRQMIEYYLGDTQPFEKIYTKDQLGRQLYGKSLCEARFYLGERYLLQKDSNDAGAQFREAVASCPSLAVVSYAGHWEPIEYDGASIELKRLGR